MKNSKRLGSVALASTALILFLILVSSAASAVTEKSVSFTGACAYITNSGSNNVSVIDTATDNVIATIDVGDHPLGIAVSPDGTKVYVTNHGTYNDPGNTVSVINTATNNVTATVPVGTEPQGVAVNPAGTKVYVTNWESNTVSVIDTATNTVTATVPVEDDPVGVVVNHAGTIVYVTSGERTVSVIDTATNTLTATVRVCSCPHGIAVSPDGTKVYVTSYLGNTVSVIDTATNKVTATVSVGGYPYGVAVNPAGTKVYVTDDGGVSVIDTATNTVTATLDVGESPEGITVNPDGTKIYVANTGAGTVSVIDASTNTVTTTVPVGSSPIAFGQFISSVSSQPVLPVANFSANPTFGTAPLNVSFTDYSKGTPTAWKWNFGDGTNSTQQNPTHAYSKAGNYTVRLTATNDAGSNTKTKSSYIKVTSVTRPIANFTSNVTSGYAPLNVAFTDKSTGVPTAWKWSFGDGTNSTVQNPTYTYSKAGNYTVVLTASNSAGSSKITKSSYIKVKNP